MIEELFTTLREFFDPNQPHVAPNVLAQTIAIVFAILLAVGLQPIFYWVLRPGKRYISNTGWSKNLLIIGRFITLPITVGVLLNITIALFLFSNNNTFILAAINRAVVVWVVYEFFRAILNIALEPEYARFWGRKVLLPVAVILAVFNALNVLDDILNIGFYSETVKVSITVGTVLFGTAILVIFLLLSKWVRQGLLSSTIMAQSGIEPSLAITVSKIISYSIILVGLLVALGSIGIDMSTLTVILGGLSVGLAFGLQEIVNNFVSGFILLFERSIVPGDVVEVSTRTGIVKTVGVRSTTVITRDNVELIIPNSMFLTEIVTNMTHTDELVRTRIAVGVSYNCKPRQVQQILLDVAHQHPDVLTEPAPSVQFKEFGESSLNFELLAWTDKAIQSVVLASNLRFQIWEALAESDIEIPFPQRDIHIRSGVPWDQLTQQTQTPQSSSQED